MALAQCSTESGSLGGGGRYWSLSSLLPEDCPTCQAAGSWMKSHSSTLSASEPPGRAAEGTQHWVDHFPPEVNSTGVAQRHLHLYNQSTT